MSDIESERLSALRSYRVLDTDPEPAFDDLASLAADLFDAPIGLLSLAEGERLWFKARVGLDLRETARERSICGQALHLSRNGVMVVEDAREDPRFAGHPLVAGWPGVRFYAGALLTDPAGCNLGTLCVLDTDARPRPSERELARLQNLARRAVDQLGARRCEGRLEDQQRVLAMAEVMSGVGHWRLDVKTGRVTLSDELYRIYGIDRSRTNLSGDDVTELLGEAGADEARRLFEKTMRERVGYEHERCFRRADGKVRHIHSRGGLELDARGEVAALFGVAQDVTKRKRAYERLRQSQAGYKLLAENMADVVTRIQLDGSADYVSPAVKSLLGYAPHEMKGRRAQEFVHPDDAPQILHIFRELSAGREEASLQHRALHKEGHPVWVETRFRLVRGEAGEPKEIVAVVRDVSERRALEAQLSASEERASRVIADAYQAIVCVDALGRVTAWNRCAEDTFGWRADEVIGQRVPDLIVPSAEHAAYLEQLNRVIDSGEGSFIDRRIEVTARRKDGAVFPVELAVSATRGPDGWQFTALMHDISERKAQMEMFETAFTHASVGIGLVNLEGRFNKVNRAFCEIIGYPEDEFLALDFQAITHPEDLARDVERFRKVINGEVESYAVDKRYIRKDGRVVPVHLAVALVRGPDGRPSHCIGQAQDLTARREAEGRYRLLAENAGDIVGLYDEAGNCLYISPSAERIFGYAPDEVVGKGPYDFIPQFAHARFREMEQKLASAPLGHTITHQLPMLHKDGRTIWVELSSRIVEDDGGRPVSIVVTRDISARLETERHYRLLTENTADMLVLANLAGDITFVSGACERVLGWTADEILTRNASIMVHPDDYPRVSEVFSRVRAGERGLQVRYRSRRKDGSWRWLESHPSLLVEEDGTRAVVDAVRDVTDHVMQEAALGEAREKAEAANQAKAEFLANMSHELRTPLNGVIGFSRLLADSPDLSPGDRRRVLLVRSAGEALNRLINDVLDFSKLEAGAVQLEARPFSVGDMVSEALSMVEPQATEKGIGIKICGEDPGALVGDKYRLRQVVLNFLSNAVKFTETGTVTVRLGCTPVEGRVRLRVAVIDEGAGIPQDKIPLLFRRFSQADGSVTRNYGGTGLGLAISRELIELMGGQIGVESQFGEGAAFWFEVELPRGQEVRRREKTQQGRMSFLGRRVLVVDDVAINRELFLEMLHHHDCEVDLACDGQEAVATVEQGDYDLVLMDVHMPVMDGMAATQAIRAAGRTTLPILALTASGAPEQVESCLAAGMDGHLLKPLSPQDLERALARVFDAAGPRAAAPQRSPAEVELDARRAFETTMGPATALRLIRLFHDDLSRRFLSTEPAELKAEAHKIASSAAMLGCLQLGEAARELERAIREGEPYATPLARVLAAKQAADRVLRNWRGELAATQ